MSYVHKEPLDENNYPLFAAIRNEFGFIPNFYRAQTMRPDLVQAEAQLVRGILIEEGALPRMEKEYVFLACSGANLNTYCVTAHCEIVRMLAIEGPQPEQIAVDYASADIPAQTKALLGFALKLNNTPTRIGGSDIEALRVYGYTDQQIMEAVLTVGLAKFANFISFGLGIIPDFDASVAFSPAEVAGTGTRVRF